MFLVLFVVKTQSLKILMEKQNASFRLSLGSLSFYLAARELCDRVTSEVYASGSHQVHLDEQKILFNLVLHFCWYNSLYNQKLKLS